MFHDTRISSSVLNNLQLVFIEFKFKRETPGNRVTNPIASAHITNSFNELAQITKLYPSLRYRLNQREWQDTVSFPIPPAAVGERAGLRMEKGKTNLRGTREA